MTAFHLLFCTPTLDTLVTPERHSWRLPSFESHHDWLAEAAHDLRLQARAALGVDGIAIGELVTADARFALMEILDATALANAALVGRDDPRFMALPPPQRDALAQLTAATATAPPWGRFAWWADAVAWIDGVLRQHGLHRTGEPRQRKAAWMGSAVIQIPTTAGDLFFKATQGTPSEAAVLQHLTAHAPRALPHLLAADVERGWQMTRDVGDIGPTDVAASSRALAAMAQIQRQETAHLASWRRLGCADRALPWLAARCARLLRELPPEMARLGVITAGEADALAAAADRAARRCHEAGYGGIPVSIHHEDFRPGNVAWQNGGPILFDWADTVISHPFMTAHRYLDDVPPPDDGQPWDCEFTPGDPRAILRDAYLEAWRGAGVSDEDLVRLFTVTRSLEPLYQLARYDAAIDVLAWARATPLAEELVIARVLFTSLAATRRRW